MAESFSKGNIVTGVLGLAVVGLIAAQFNGSSNVRSLEQELAAARAAESEHVERLEGEIKDLHAALEAAQSDAREQIAALERVSGRNRALAGGLRTDLDETKAAVEDSAARGASRDQALEQRQAEIASRVEAVGETADAAQAGVAKTSGEIEELRGDAATTRAQLEETGRRLAGVSDEVESLDSRTADNTSAIASLRQSGERNEIDFVLFRRVEPVRVGGIELLLTATDAAMGRYSLELVMGEYRVVKQNLVVNEPVQFYLGGSRQLYELVVNEIGADRVSGYLLEPAAAAAP